MAAAFAILLLCQLAGEGIVHATGAPVPGPVLGLLLLAAGLAWRERGRAASSLAGTPLVRASEGLLNHLSLLFVPAAVGVVQQGAVLLANGLAIAAALVVSTVLTLGVTAATFAWTARLVRRRAP